MAEIHMCIRCMKYYTWWSCRNDLDCCRECAKLVEPLIEWFNEVWDERTKRVNEGIAHPDEIDPRYRVMWTEIVMKARELGFDDNVVTMREWWQQLHDLGHI